MTRQEKIDKIIKKDRVVMSLINISNINLETFSARQLIESLTNFLNDNNLPDANVEVLHDAGPSNCSLEGLNVFVSIPYSKEEREFLYTQYLKTIREEKKIKRDRKRTEELAILEKLKNKYDKKK